MKEINITELFFWHIRKNYRSQRAAAEHYKVTDSFISSVLKGNRPPNKQMLADLGVEKKVEKKTTYRRISQ